MARQKKEGEYRTFKLRTDILNRLDRFSEKSMYPKTAIVERALLKYFNEHENELIYEADSNKTKENP